MTIAGGLVCDDGVLVYADTEWTATTLKIQRGKHWRLGGVPRLKCVIAGAGNEDSLRLAIQGFWANVNNSDLDADKIRTKDALDCLRKALEEIYKHQIYPDPKGDEKEFGMVVGMSTPDDPPLLFKTVGPDFLISDSYEYMGSGSEMAMYLSSRLDVRGMPLEVGQAMASFILWEVKQHVQTCGGESVIYKLGKDNSFQYLGEGEAREIEEYFAHIDRKIQRIRVKSAILRQSGENFEKALADFCEELRTIRKARLERLEREKDFTA